MNDPVSISLPIAIFLIPYALFIIVYFVYSVFNVYHLTRFGILGFKLYFVTTIFIGGSLALLAGSIILLLQYNWAQIIGINDLFFSGPNGIFGI